MEIADSPKRNYRAYIACDLNHCQPRIYIENTQNNKLLEFDWSGHIPNRPITRIIWLGDDYLSFGHLTGPHNLVIGVLQVKKRELKYFWLAGDPCE